MKIAVWGINYAPELTGIAPYNQILCEHLQQTGHESSMVTTFAYYPAWKKAEADRGRLFRTDNINGVKVHRCCHYVPAKVSSLKRIFHEATFVATSFLRLLTLPTPDVYVVVSPPLLLGLVAWLLTRFRRAPFVFHVQDLQPDAAMALGMLKPSTFTRLLYWLEAVAYRKAAPKVFCRSGSWEVGSMYSKMGLVMKSSIPCVTSAATAQPNGQSKTPTRFIR